MGARGTDALHEREGESGGIAERAPGTLPQQWESVGHGAPSMPEDGGRMGELWQVASLFEEEQRARSALRRATGLPARAVSGRRSNGLTPMGLAGRLV